ncbi:hypothetical protein JW777_04695 [bacterium]|nr:hypothetical protein [bacterium]
MLRLIFWMLLIYFGIKTVRVMTRRPDKEDPRVKGRPKNEPLDLSRSDVQDAHFEDIDDGRKKGGES